MAQETLAKTGAQEAPKFEVPKKKKKWPKRLAVVLILAAVLLTLLWRCSAGAGQVLAGNYISSPAQVRDMTVAVTGPGTVKPNDTYKATTLVKGEVLSAPFEEGDTVSKDDVLFTLDAEDVENAIKQARIGVEQAQLSVASAQLNYDSMLRTQKDDAEDRQVKANAGGVVTKVYVDPGDTVSMGTPIADILDRDTMKLQVPFHAVDAQGFYVGQSALVTVSGTAETLTGTVSEIAATDSVGLGGTLVRNVTIQVQNPGALSSTSTGSASVGAAASSATGTFQYNSSKQLVALYSGKLETLSVKEGDRVYDGQVLGQFEGKNIQDQVDAAAISLENAKLTLRNAQDSLARAESNLEDYTITSPIDGIVIEKNYKAGDNIDPSTATATGASPFLAVIYDMSRLTFDIGVSERDVVKLQVGQAVTFTADALDDASFTGVVEKININGTTVNGNTSYPVTVAVDGDGLDLARQGLLPGMSVSANIIVENAGSVLTIPVNAVDRDGTVLVALEGAVDESGMVVDPSKSERRAVELGRNDADYIEVLSGLSEGEVVLIQNNASSILAMMSGGRM